MPICSVYASHKVLFSMIFLMLMSEIIRWTQPTPGADTCFQK